MLVSRGFLGALLISPALGQIHHFYSGIFSGDNIFGIEFDEASSELSVLYNGTLELSSSKWIATDVSRITIRTIFENDGFLTIQYRKAKQIFTLRMVMHTKVILSTKTIPSPTGAMFRFRKAVSFFF